MNIIQCHENSPNGAVGDGSVWYPFRLDMHKNTGAFSRMTTMVQHPIVLKSGDAVGDGVLHLRAFDARERKLRAAKTWALMWLFAVLSLPIIIAHFVLVPGFLIAGPVMAFKRYRVTEVPDHVSGNCPAGKEEFTLALESSDRLPMWSHCPVCKSSLQLLEKAGAGAA